MKCGCCGADIGDISFDKSFKMPDEIWALTEKQRNERARVDSDLCQLDDKFFIRGVAYIPVLNTDKFYGWGIWAEIPEEKFFEYVENYDLDNSSQQRFEGVVANQIADYSDCLNLKVEIQLGNETQRPMFYFKKSNHVLTEQQQAGISIERVHSFQG
ncbi:DUF2199 domain-containing protein [Pseudoalteromonas sp. T1lg122]|uniref:DUF2199 domain-containing protein n=1 Tax=Pseudoalteromonas sp. T1lg122 TaxID=2077094 RepID=UPI000CF63983|nr:DUF2199 domain-containing protein [Pseudoalteromonas sp. T1lg122]